MLVKLANHFSLSSLAKYVVLLVLVMTGSLLSTDAVAADILPEGIEYDSAVPSPKEFLGFEIGERHIRHHELVSFLKAISEVSTRATIHTYASSHGKRPLVHMTITSPGNHRRLEQIRSQHLALADPNQSEKIDIESLPVVMNMGYSVHGDESSAGNAAALVAYHLAAARGVQIEKLLEDVIVVLDPCLNPDGFDRFASWANSYRGQMVNADRNHLEHNQPFPGGRVNHYWFDLNRDWLPAQHPESQGRLHEYYRWRPNVVLDFHEMSPNSTYFLQPGIQIRTNPLTPEENQRLTYRMAKFHAKALDRIGSMYYTEERFDDFYMGKGSTYPDLHGAVGILFEQASSRGLVLDTVNGPLRFPFTIKNQFTTSLSSLDAVQSMRQDLLEYKRAFYQESLESGQQAVTKAYVFRCDDPERLSAFATVLARHQIQMRKPINEMKFEGQDLSPQTTLVVSNNQPEYLFIQSLLSRQKTFPENVFYDVSTWTLPLAFNVEQIDLSRLPPSKKTRSYDPLGVHDGGDAPAESKRQGRKASQRRKQKRASFSDADVAYLLEWTPLSSPRILQQLLQQGVKVKVAKVPFDVDTEDGTRHFDNGTLMVHVGHQSLPIRKVQSLLRNLDSAAFHVCKSGLTPKGVDLGSDMFAVVEEPKLLLLVGEGSSRYEAGEVWHLLDQRVHMPLTMVTADQLGGVDLHGYTTVAIVSGSYENVSKASIDKLKEWISAGGTLISVGSGCSWVEKQQIVSNVLRLSDETNTTERPKSERESVQLPFASARKTRALDLVRGAIFEAKVDLTHPIAYGISTPTLPVFRNNRVFLAPSKNPYANPAVYTNEPQMSGYCSQENVERIKESAAVVIRSRGRGRVVLMSDNPNFRAFWYGSNRLFVNAIFFGDLMTTP